jgi:bifunctional DNA-binding transcriptional regulator/antitoxin component of YhaV-PrlF toxin-antitoxin module
VGKRGSIIVPKGLVAELGFVENDKFLVRKTKSGISLKRLYN